MANILCTSCGEVIDSRQRACPLCGRCPCCEAQASAAEAVCRSCGHPENEDHIRAMESALDPTKPENIKLARSLHRGYENEQVLKRMYAGRFVLLMLLLTFLMVLTSFFVTVTLLGLPDRWVMPNVMLLYFIIFFLLVNLLRLGYFPWLLHPPAGKDSGNASAGTGPSEKR